MNSYPENWPEISFAAKVRAKFTCQRCWDVSDPWNALSLHTHHIDFDKANCDPLNLRVLCVYCHFKVHLENDPLLYKGPRPVTYWRVGLPKTSHIKEILNELIPKVKKIQRINLNEVKP